jgi:hypothetical protein
MDKKLKDTLLVATMCTAGYAFAGPLGLMAAAIVVILKKD